MSDEDLIKYFIAQTNERLGGIEKKLDDLLAFKWKVLGIACAVSVLVSVASEALFGR